MCVHAGKQAEAMQREEGITGGQGEGKEHTGYGGALLGYTPQSF